MTAQAALADPFESRYRAGFVDHGELRLHYTDWNRPEPDAPNVVLVHGLNAQLHTWDPIAAELSADHRVVCVDLRGHGAEAWAPDGYPVGAFVGDLQAVVDTLGLAPAHVVGHSLGARIAIAFAAEHSASVDRLVLSDGGPEIAAGGAEVVRANPTNAARRGFGSVDEARAVFREQYPDWDDVFYDLHVKYQLRTNWIGKLVWRSDPELYWLSTAAARREAPYLWEACTRVAAPTLILRGACSYLLDSEIAGRMLEAIPDATEHVFDTGHYIPREQPTRFAAAVRDFLAASHPHNAEPAR